jgi:hypothetical protein
MILWMIHLVELIIIEHRLEFGNALYSNEGKTSQKQDLEIYNYEFDKEKNYSKEELKLLLSQEILKIK